MTVMKATEPYAPNESGILMPEQAVVHREEEYDSGTFDELRDMQARHFWYLGRHRFILHSLKRALRAPGNGRAGGLQAIDLGGGCGGWVRYLKDHWPQPFDELALADSSLRALAMAQTVVGSETPRYQIDLLQLQWQNRWDVAFLLDVLEHIPNDVDALHQVREALRIGGLLVITTPALDCFWTYNDEAVHHVRRYSRKDYSRLARRCGLELCFSRYFMFFLSPLLLASRWKSPPLHKMSEAEVLEYVKRTHRVPSWPVNQTLRLIFSLESPLGVQLPFPWGTSVLAVLRRPT